MNGPFKEHICAIELYVPIHGFSSSSPLVPDDRVNMYSNVSQIHHAPKQLGQACTCLTHPPAFLVGVRRHAIIFEEHVADEHVMVAKVGRYRTHLRASIGAAD